MPKEWVQAQSRALALRTAAEVNYRYRMARVHAEIEAQKVRRRENFWFSRVGRAVKWVLVTLGAASVGFGAAWLAFDRLHQSGGSEIATITNDGHPKNVHLEQKDAHQEMAADAIEVDPIDQGAAGLLTPEDAKNIDALQLNRLLGWGLSTTDVLAPPNLEPDAQPKPASEAPLQHTAQNQPRSTSVELEAAIGAAKSRLATSGQTRSAGALDHQRAPGAVDGDLLRSIEASRKRNTAVPSTDAKTSRSQVDPVQSINSSVERNPQSFEVISRFDWGVMVRVGNQVKPVKKGEVLPDGTQLN